MISCLLVKITRNNSGQAVREERIIHADTLKIGRGADCVIHLPDPRIYLDHASINRADDGRLYLESSIELLSFNGEFRKRELLAARTRILIGPYLFIVEDIGSEHDVILGYELVQPLSDELTELKQRSRTSLSETGLSKRAISNMLAILTGFIFLLLPVMNMLSPNLHASTENLPIGLDEAWNPGPISSAHKAIANDCQQCHKKPFVRVEDTACTTCHKDIADHLPDNTMQAHLFGETRCASCHLEHKESHDLVSSNPQLCVDCHGDLEAHKMNGRAITLKNIHDFSSDHPEFSLSIKNGVAANQIRRISQADKKNLYENSGLKFPHDVHLADKGINSPDGRIKMQCSNCHIPDEAGVRFKPIAMQTHCASCHRLEFEPAVTTRQVPHGDVRQIMTTLREFYGNQSIRETPIDIATVDGLLRRPDQAVAKAERRNAAGWADQKANTVATDLFEVRVCATCHSVTKTGNNLAAPWEIMPVNITQHWLPKNNFSHKQHSNSECKTCHNPEISKRSNDINIPDIASCRKCHAGAKPARNKVTSTCESCHGFHLPGHSASSAEQIKSAHGGITKKAKAAP